MISSFSRLRSANRSSGFDIVDGTGSFDAYRQPVETGRFERLAPRASVDWTVRLRRDVTLRQPLQGLLLVSLENRTGPTQAQLVPVRRVVG